MAQTFPRVRRSQLGYSTGEVESFLTRARAAFDDRRGGRMSAADIRTTAFAMQKGGYATAAVDTALERLEDEFSKRERDRAVREVGQKAYFKSTRGLAKEVTDRLGRPRRHRFDRVGLLTVGYSVRDVDAFADRVLDFFEHGEDVSVDEVRGVAFRPARRGYREAQVDLLVDCVVEVMLAVRH